MLLGSSGCSGSSSATGFLKPLMAEPKSVPMLRRRLVPNSMTTMARIIRSCHMLMPLIPMTGCSTVKIKRQRAQPLGFARRFFLVPGNTEATRQFIQYRLGVFPSMRKHHQAVKPKIGGFGNQLPVVAAGLRVLGGKDRFGCLLAHFF